MNHTHARHLTHSLAVLRRENQHLDLLVRAAVRDHSYSSEIVARGASENKRVVREITAMGSRYEVLLLYSYSSDIVVWRAFEWE